MQKISEGSGRVMGNSCATSAGRSNQRQSQGSKVAPPVMLTTFNWSIDGFSSLLQKRECCTNSGVFEIMGHNWILNLNLRDRKSGDEKEYVSLGLELLASSVKPDTIVEASFKFLIYDQSYGKHSEHEVSHNFQTASTSSGIPCMIPLNTLKEPASGFLFNNSCVFGVKFLKVVTSKTKSTFQRLFVQKSSVFNVAKVYTWDIEDFFALKNLEYSPEFEVGGLKWFISMYQIRDGNHLGLSLHMKTPNDLPKSSTNLVELTISIKDQENGKHLKGTGRCQFSNNAAAWGWRKFISMEDFKDPSNGYLVKSKCCIEAEVAIVGSSKTD
ncbi:hypothetical protein ACP70R_019119 [Stipagrostis hirtigluma subsp. patula]